MSRRAGLRRVVHCRIGLSGGRQATESVVGTRGVLDRVVGGLAAQRFVRVSTHAHDLLAHSHVRSEFANSSLVNLASARRTATFAGLVFPTWTCGLAGRPWLDGGCLHA